jgi:hypothetical protein
MTSELCVAGDSQVAIVTKVAHKLIKGLCLHAKCLLFLSDISQIWNVSTNFSELPITKFCKKKILSALFEWIQVADGRTQRG